MPYLMQSLLKTSKAATSPFFQCAYYYVRGHTDYANYDVVQISQPGKLRLVVITPLEKYKMIQMHVSII